MIAAAVAAPGASASPAPVGVGTFAGVIIQGTGPRGFQTRVIVNGDRTAAGQILLAQDVEVRITVEHDVESWGDGVVAEGPRTGRLLVPAGSYPADNSYSLGSRRAWFSLPRRSPTTRLTTDPTGTFPVAVAVAQGPVFPGRDPSITLGWGLPMATRTIDV